MKHKNKVGIISLFALLVVAFSNSSWSAEDLYPYKWKEIVPTGIYFHTVKFCNDYKNILCVSDSTIEILDAKNGKSLRKKKYDFHIKFVRDSKYHSFVAVNFWGGNIGMIDLNTLELIKTIEIFPFVDDMCFTKDKLVITHNLDQEGKYMSIVDLVNYKLTKNDNIFYNSMIVYNEKQDLFYILDSYLGSGGSNNSRLYQFDLKSNKATLVQSFGNFFKNFKLSPQENYLGFINSDNSQIKIFDLNDFQKPTEIKEIDFKCKVFSFSYDEKEIFYDYSANLDKKRSYIYSLEYKKIINNIENILLVSIDVNQENEFVFFTPWYLQLLNHRFFSSIEQDNKSVKFRNYDNFIYIELLENNITNSMISITDSLGRLIKQQHYNSKNFQINTNLLPIGAYFIHIKYENFNETFKFIKE